MPRVPAPLPWMRLAAPTRADTLDERAPLLDWAAARSGQGDSPHPALSLLPATTGRAVARPAALARYAVPPVTAVVGEWERLARLARAELRPVQRVVAERELALLLLPPAGQFDRLTGDEWSLLVAAVRTADEAEGRPWSLALDLLDAWERAQPGLTRRADDDDGNGWPYSVEDGEAEQMRAPLRRAHVDLERWLRDAAADPRWGEEIARWLERTAMSVRVRALALDALRRHDDLRPDDVVGMPTEVVHALARGEGGRAWAERQRGEIVRRWLAAPGGCARGSTQPLAQALHALEEARCALTDSEVGALLAGASRASSRHWYEPLALVGAVVARPEGARFLARSLDRDTVMELLRSAPPGEGRRRVLATALRYYSRMTLTALPRLLRENPHGWTAEEAAMLLAADMDREWRLATMRLVAGLRRAPERPDRAISVSRRR